MYFVAFFRCKFYSPKILLVLKKWQISGMPVVSTQYALSLNHQLVLRRKKYERGNCCYSACADLPACLYYKCPGVCIYDGHWHPSIDPMRQHHQDGGHKIDAFEEVWSQKKKAFLMTKLQLLFLGRQTQRRPSSASATSTRAGRTISPQTWNSFAKMEPFPRTNLFLPPIPSSFVRF